MSFSLPFHCCLAQPLFTTFCAYSIVQFLFHGRAIEIKGNNFKLGASSGKACTNKRCGSGANFVGEKKAFEISGWFYWYNVIVSVFVNAREGNETIWESFEPGSLKY